MSEVKEDAKVKKQTVAEMDDEIRRLELESKKLEVAEKKANLQDLEERLAERELKRETKRQASLTNGQTLKQLELNDTLKQSRCNHRKGGNGAYGVVAGQGDDPTYAVMKHIFSNGDTWIRCMRCGRTWKPPVRSQFTSPDLYDIAQARYQQALEFQTRNVTSGSIMFRFSDGGENFRQTLANTTLR